MIPDTGSAACVEQADVFPRTEHIVPGAWPSETVELLCGTDVCQPPLVALPALLRTGGVLDQPGTTVHYHQWPPQHHHTPGTHTVASLG